MSEFGVNYDEIRANLERFRDGRIEAIQAALQAATPRNPLIEIRDQQNAGFLANQSYMSDTISGMDFDRICDLQIRMAEASNDAEMGAMWREFKETKDPSKLKLNPPLNLTAISAGLAELDETTREYNPRFGAWEALEKNLIIATQKRILQAAVEQYSLLTTQFIEAVNDSDMTRAIQLIRLGGDPNTTGENGTTALIVAAKAGDATAITQLKELGADMTMKNSAGKTALMIAVQNHHVDAAFLLFDEQTRDIKDNEGQTALHIALKEWQMAVATNGTETTEKMLNIINLWKDIDINTVDPAIREALTNARAEIERRGIQTQPPRQNLTLLQLVEQGNASAVRERLAQDASQINMTDGQGRTPLIVAIEKADPQIVLALLAVPAPNQAQTTFSDQRPAGEQNAFKLALKLYAEADNDTKKQKIASILKLLKEKRPDAYETLPQELKNQLDPLIGTAQPVTEPVSIPENTNWGPVPPELQTPERTDAQWRAMAKQQLEEVKRKAEERKRLLLAKKAEYERQMDERINNAPEDQKEALRQQKAQGVQCFTTQIQLATAEIQMATTRLRELNNMRGGGRTGGGGGRVGGGGHGGGAGPVVAPGGGQGVSGTPTTTSGIPTPEQQKKKEEEEKEGGVWGWIKRNWLWVVGIIGALVGGGIWYKKYRDKKKAKKAAQAAASVTTSTTDGATTTNTLTSSGTALASTASISTASTTTDVGLSTCGTNITVEETPLISNTRSGNTL